MFFNGKNRSRALVVVGALMVFLFVCGASYASSGGEHAVHDTTAVSGSEAQGEHGGGAGAHDSGKKMTDLIYRVINFSLLVIILFVVVKKTPIKDFFANRIEEIKNNFEDLNKEKELAEKRYQELEEKLKDFEASRQEIIDQYKAEGAAEKDKIIAEAGQRAKQILRQAELTIQREIQAAGEMLKQEILDDAAKRAQEILAKEMKESDQDHLVDEFIKSVEKLH
jgi:F-type H+-transporting ATPase subunit b